MGLSCDPPLGLLCIPILLVALPFARAGEEVCCSGAYSMAPPLGDLEQLDGARLSFCCVACNLSYCCSSAEARLNQQLCSALQADPADDRGKGFIQPRTIQPAIPDLGWFFIAIIVAAGLAVCMYCCYNCYQWIWDWLLSHDELERPTEWEGVAPPGVTSLCPTLPAYVSTDPPAYHAEDPEDACPVLPTPAPPAPVVQLQRLFSSSPEAEAAPCSSAVSDPPLAPRLETESSAPVAAAPRAPLEQEEAPSEAGLEALALENDLCFCEPIFS